MTSQAQNMAAESEAQVEHDRGSSRRIEFINLMLFLVGSGWFFFYRDRAEALGFFLGGLINAVNLRLMISIIHGFTGGQAVSKKKLTAQVLIKFVGGLGALALILLKVKPPAVPFLLGLSTVVLAVLAEGVIGIFRRDS